MLYILKSFYWSQKLLTSKKCSWVKSFIGKQFCVLFLEYIDNLFILNRYTEHILLQK